LKVSSLFVFSIFTTLFFAIFYNTVTITAGVYIASDLGGSTETSVYPMVFFGVGNLLSLPLTTPFADRFGGVKILSLSLFLFFLFSVLCASAQTFFLFNVYRVGMGFAIGPMFIITRRLLIAFTPKPSHERYFFYMILMFATIPVLGASFGAWLAYETHWRSIFTLHLPLVFSLALYFWKKIEGEKRGLFVLDKIGYAFFAYGISSLITSLTLVQQLDWYRSSLICFLFITSLVSLIFFLLWTKNHPTPLFEFHLLKSPVLSYALINLAVLFACYFGMIILLSLWLNLFVVYTPLWISLLLCIMGVAALIGYFVSRDILSYFDPRWTLCVAILSFAFSCYYSTYFDVDIDFTHLAIARFFAGMGLVLFLFSLARLSLASHPLEKSDSVYEFFQITRIIFSSLGAALFCIGWQRRWAFFHERLGENLNWFSQLTQNFFHRGENRFYLTEERTKGELANFLDRQATSLALNDIFGLMGYILLGLLVLLALTFLYEKVRKKKFS